MFEHDLKDYNDGQDYHWRIKCEENGVKGGKEFVRTPSFNLVHLRDPVHRVQNNEDAHSDG